jgi:hypothetical protein
MLLKSVGARELRRAKLLARALCHGSSSTRYACITLHLYAWHGKSNLRQREICDVTVIEDASVSLTLLFDPEHHLEERILREQFQA